MIKRWVLASYFGKQYLYRFLAFLAALMGIVFLFEVAELMRRSGSKHEVPFNVILTMAAYKLPDTIEQILPFVVLFAGLLTFWKLTRTQELIVARAAGVSAWQFAAPALLVTFLFGIINITVLNSIGASLHGRYKELEIQYLDASPTFEFTGTGLWMRQSYQGNNYLIHADKVKFSPLTLVPVVVFVYDEEGRYIKRIDAPEAQLIDSSWVVPNAIINFSNNTSEEAEEWDLPTNLTVSKIQDSMTDPNTISVWELPKFIETLEAIGLPTMRHEVAFHSILAQPVALLAMALFAVAFSLRLNRRGGVLPMIIAGVFIGSLAHFLNKLVLALGMNNTLPIVLATWAIPVIMLALGIAALLHIEESG
ncbi:MAG: LPS export ABC transporter permease LptG [Alphaproteobacteria bacterium]|nr:LPS export ABC transporter permease LptG [Alphaproteobacteria bacterium]MCL2504864.1 LPS export ABC transporter permease LptG [Alphaproteobacteria bacterium]